jgi:Raf kinase inhibitor-like YbhB/YbcL family protein
MTTIAGIATRRVAMTIGRWAWLLALAVALATMPSSGRGREVGMTMTLTSPDFTAGAAVPARFTCDAEGASPALQWSGVPSAARSLALVVDDPDAPQRTWVHWVLYDLPHDSTGLPQSVAAAQLPTGSREGLNDWKKTGYGAPCPPTGRHRYVFTLYALDRALPDLQRPDKAQLLKAMEGHVLAKAQLIGTYQRKP